MSAHRSVVVCRPVGFIGRRSPWPVEIPLFRIGCALCLPAVVWQSLPKLPLTQEGTLHTNQIGETARRICRYAGQAGNPHVFPRILWVIRRLKRRSVFVFAAAECYAPTSEVGCAAGLEKLVVGRGFDRGDDIGIHGLPAQRNRCGYQKGIGARRCTERLPVVFCQTR